MASPGKAAAPGVVQRVIYEVAAAAGAEGMVAGQVMDVIYENKAGDEKDR